jgi:hypothetical protein
LTKNCVEVNTAVKHSMGAFKSKLNFNFKGAEKDCQGCSYSTEQGNSNTVNFSNGVSVRGKLKPKVLQGHVDLPRRILRDGNSFIPYVRFEVARGTTKVTPFIGSMLFWGDIKWNVLAYNSGSPPAS